MQMALRRGGNLGAAASPKGVCRLLRCSEASLTSPQVHLRFVQSSVTGTASTGPEIVLCHFLNEGGYPGTRFGTELSGFQ